MLVSIRIAEGRGAKVFIHEKENIPVQGGILEYSYTFEKSGIHEIFFDFTFANDTVQKVHELPDFLIDVQKLTSEKILDNRSFVFGIGVGIVLGLVMGLVLGKRRNAHA
jgi:hypothetical protein